LKREKAGRSRGERAARKHSSGEEGDKKSGSKEIQEAYNPTCLGDKMRGRKRWEDIEGSDWSWKIDGQVFDLLGN
jgi:hypothetical protein